MDLKFQESIVHSRPWRRSDVLVVVQTFPISEIWEDFGVPSSPIKRCIKTPLAKDNPLDLPLLQGITASILQCNP